MVRRSYRPNHTMAPITDRAARVSSDPQAQILGKPILAARVGGLDRSQVEVREHEHRSHDRQSERELAHHERAAELRQGHDHSPLADGVDRVAANGPGKVGVQRQSGQGWRLDGDQGSRVQGPCRADLPALMRQPCRSGEPDAAIGV